MSVNQLLENVHHRLECVRQDREISAPYRAPNFSVFSLFRPCKSSGTKEILLTKVITELLNPKGSHAQGRLFLELFLARAIPALTIRGINDIRVDCEDDTRRGRRIDITIATEDAVIAIENKPWARDSNNQLQDYWEEVKARAREERKPFIIHLTGWLRDVGQSTMETKLRDDLKAKGQLISMCYENGIESWLSDCWDGCKADHVRQFILDFRSYVRRTFIGETDMTESREVVDAATLSPEALSAALMVSREITKVKFETLKRFAHQVQTGVGDHEMAAEIDPESKMNGDYWCITFSDALCRIPERVSFEFNTKNYKMYPVYGILAIEEQTSRSSAVGEFLRNERGEGFSDQYWVWADNPPGERDWSVSDAPWIQALDGTLATTMIKLARSILDTLILGPLPTSVD